MFKRETLTIIEVEGALCMWEHILDNVPNTYLPYLDGHGYAALRHCSMQAGLIAHQVYELLEAQGHEYCTSYDWEFVPAIAQMIDWDMCAYHADNGDMCAAGRLIPSNLYHHNMEAKTIRQVFKLYPDVAEHIGQDNLPLVERLQDLHDNEEPQYWAEELNNLARRRELTP